MVCPRSSWKSIAENVDPHIVEGSGLEPRPGFYRPSLPTPIRKVYDKTDLAPDRMQPERE